MEPTAFETSGLDENGIVIEGDNAPVAPKGQYIAATSPESFVDGYLFLSTESSDKLANAIHTLRSPEGDNPEQNLKDAIDAIMDNEDIGNLASNLKAFMSTTAVMTNDGTFFVGDQFDSNNSANHVIVSSKMTQVANKAIDDLTAFLPGIIAVDFHSGVVSFDDGVANRMKSEDLVKDVYFVYNNEEIKAIDEAEGDIANLIMLGERNQHIQTLKLVYVDQATQEIIPGSERALTDFTNYSFKCNFVYPYFGTADKAYEFVVYSLQPGGANPIALGTTERPLTETEKQLISNDGTLYVYAVFKEVEAAFKVDDVCYSSAMVTRMLANGAEELIPGTQNISVILDKIATLGSATQTSLTIPEGVTLWVPCSTTTYSRTNGQHVPAFDVENKTYGEFDKDEDGGESKLIIADNVTLTNKGYITVDAQLHRFSSSHFGFVAEDSGVLVVNGKIVNNDGGRIEAYGVVRTDANGTMEAKPGSTVVEVMAILDLHGGTSTSIAIMAGVAPFNHYTVDNIRLPLTVEAGAVYTTYGTIYANDTENSLEYKIADATATPDSNSSSNPLFYMHQGSKIVKSYDADEGIQVTVYGTVEDCKKSINVAGTEVSFNEGEWVSIPMPLPDFDITVASGATLSLSKVSVYKVLPGSDVLVEEGGTLNINCRVVVYDSFELEGGTLIDARNYAGKFTSDSATLKVKGTLVLQSNAQFMGKIEGDANDANSTDTVKSTIVIETGARTDSKVWKEGSCGGDGKWEDKPITEGYRDSGISLTTLTVKGFDWLGKWQTAPGVFGQIPMSENANATYEYTGGIWEAK